MFLNIMKGNKTMIHETYEIIGIRNNNIEKFVYEKGSLTYFVYDTEKKEFVTAKVKKMKVLEAREIMRRWCRRGFETYFYRLAKINKLQERTIIKQIQSK